MTAADVWRATVPAEFEGAWHQWVFTKNRAIKSPMNLPNFRKRGYHVVSLSNVVKWMAERCEAAGIEIYPGFAGAEILTEGNRVIGVRTGDMGVDKDGQPKDNFQPGMDILAKVTVLGEGVRGSLSKQLIEKFDLEGERPQVFETGVKEIWRVKPEKHQPGRVTAVVQFVLMNRRPVGMSVDHLHHARFAERRLDRGIGQDGDLEGIVALAVVAEILVQTLIMSPQFRKDSN